MLHESPTAVPYTTIDAIEGYRSLGLGVHRCEPMFARIEPFPTHCFPAPVEQYLHAQSITQNCHVASIALPVLSVLASAIGSTRRIRLQANWTEPAVLWTATVAEPGLLRSPPLDAAVQPLRDREEISFEEYETRLLEYEPLLTRFKRAKRQYVGYGKVPIQPPEPVVERYLASEWNLKSLTRVLKDQPRGLLMCTEELDGWMGRTLSVTNRRSEDLQTWLDLFECKARAFDRQTGKRKSQYLLQPCVSVTGTVDPNLLVRKLTKAATPCVLASRLLMAMPNAEPMTLADEDISDEIQFGYDTVVSELLRLPFVQQSRAFVPKDQPPHVATEEIIRNRQLTESLREQLVHIKQELGTVHNFQLPPVPPLAPAEPAPPLPPDVTRARAGIVEVSREARQRLSLFLEQIANLKHEVDCALATWFANLPKQTARLALVLHLTRHAAGHNVDPSVCDETSMEHAITLATWFANEAMRIVAVQSICAHDQELFKLTDWIAQHGGTATTREISRALSRTYPTFEHVEKALQKLVDTRVAVWKTIEPGPQGGRPVRYISLGANRDPANFTVEDEWTPPPPVEPTKPTKKGKKSMTMADWDAMYPASDEFMAMLRGGGKKKGTSDEGSADGK